NPVARRERRRPALLRLRRPLRRPAVRRGDGRRHEDVPRRRERRGASRGGRARVDRRRARRALGPRHARPAGAARKPDRPFEAGRRHVGRGEGPGRRARRGSALDPAARRGRAPDRRRIAGGAAADAAGRRAKRPLRHGQLARVRHVGGRPGSGRGSVIRHRPAGRGHPYLDEPDQRNPVHPFAGTGFTLGAVTSADVHGLTLELERGGEVSTVEPRRLGAAIPAEIDGWGARAPGPAGGHLAETAAVRPEEGAVAWRTDVPALSAGESLRYRFRTDREATEWFDVTACVWNAGAGALQVAGPESLADRLLPGSVSFLTDGSLVYAARFALRLEEGERIVGFGERFNRVELRGTRVDSAVFDQYKGQGE